MYSILFITTNKTQTLQTNMFEMFVSVCICASGMDYKSRVMWTVWSGLIVSFLKTKLLQYGSEPLSWKQILGLFQNFLLLEKKQAEKTSWR